MCWNCFKTESRESRGQCFASLSLLSQFGDKIVGRILEYRFMRETSRVWCDSVNISLHSEHFVLNLAGRLAQPENASILPLSSQVMHRLHTLPGLWIKIDSIGWGLLSSGTSESGDERPDVCVGEWKVRFGFIHAAIRTNLRLARSYLWHWRHAISATLVGRARVALVIVIEIKLDYWFLRTGVLQTKRNQER